MVELQHPLKHEIDRLQKALNETNQQFLLYFQGTEKQAPLAKRKEIEEKMQWLRSEIGRKPNAALNFQFRQLEARFVMMANRWTKTLADIEAGIYRIPPKRK